jgi:hypothetical protein
MNARERLRQAIDQHERRLRAEVPRDSAAATLALIQARDSLTRSPAGETRSDLVTERHIADPSGNKALQLCLEATPSDTTAALSSTGGAGLIAWAERFLDACGQLAEAELVLSHVERGFMLLVDDGNETFDAWIATRRTPTTWRERTDLEWWASWLARRHESERQSLEHARLAAERGNPDQEIHYRQLANVLLKMMAYQLSYPPEATIGGCSLQTYRDVLGELIARALQARDCNEMIASRSEGALIASIASRLDAEPEAVTRAVDAFAVDAETAAYHAAVPGVAAAPLVRIGVDQVVWSTYGLTSEPLLFLARELRRRATQEYHNAAIQREGVFRQELYGLFQDRRFVTSPVRIELRREAGDVRTDVDAAVFDRKTGTLGLFELKSQDPFARSTAELNRQRDNVLYANRQISGVLAWIQRHGANALLQRVDARTAKTFRAQKVYPFVLGRYLVHFNDGPEPDRRAAWGTWPQVLRLLDSQPFRATDANPIASLFTRLTKELPLIQTPTDGPSGEVVLGDARLVVHPSYTSFRARTTDERATE